MTSSRCGRDTVNIAANFIEPQAQLVYQNIHINDASDIAAQIRFADVDSLLVRAHNDSRRWLVLVVWILPLPAQAQNVSVTLVSCGGRSGSNPHSRAVRSIMR
jgi:hypothetical protein